MSKIPNFIWRLKMALAVLIALLFFSQSFALDSSQHPDCLFSLSSMKVKTFKQDSRQVEKGLLLSFWPTQEICDNHHVEHLDELAYPERGLSNSTLPGC